MRVKETDIKSKAKVHIIVLQNRLNQYDSLYKNNQRLDIKNDSDLIAMQDMDENSPPKYYISELKLINDMLFSRTKNTCTPVYSLRGMPTNPANKDTTSTKL